MPGDGGVATTSARAPASGHGLKKNLRPGIRADSLVKAALHTATKGKGKVFLGDRFLSDYGPPTCQRSREGGARPVGESAKIQGHVVRRLTGDRDGNS
jgi:hypothetical protein